MGRRRLNWSIVSQSQQLHNIIECVFEWGKNIFERENNEHQSLWSLGRLFVFLERCVNVFAAAAVPVFVVTSLSLCIFYLLYFTINYFLQTTYTSKKGIIRRLHGSLKLVGYASEGDIRCIKPLWIDFLLFGSY